MQGRTEIAIRQLLQLWDGNESKVFQFTKIRDTLGWNSRKTSDILKRATKIGFVEKIDKGYKSKLPDYNGYFNARDFVKKVDDFCLKEGLVQSFDYYLYTFSPLHILAYGVPKFENLTPIENEMLEAVFGRMVAAFSDYTRLCDSIKRRIHYEQENLPLPDLVKANLFVKDTNEEKRSQMPLLDITAAHKIYGDALWEHIFYKIVFDLHFALVKGSLDLTGPEELIAIRMEITNLAFDLASRIYQGEFSSRYSGDIQILKHLGMAFNRFPNLKSDFKSLCYGVVLTPSPRTIDEYSESVGKIVEDSFEFWSDPENMIMKAKQKGKNVWDDRFEIENQLVKRKTLFREALVDKLSTMRTHKEDVISKVEKKFMLQDRRLSQVFNYDEIETIVNLVRELTRRARKFHQMLNEKTPIEEMQKDPEWFTEKELRSFKVADRVLMRAEWERDFGTSGPIQIKIPMDDEEMRKIAEAYMRKARKEIKGR